MVDLPLHTSLEIFGTADAIADHFATELIARIRSLTAIQANFTLAVCGGRTIPPLVARLNEPAFRTGVPWELVKVFFVDERAVGPTHPESNYRSINEAWLRGSPIPPANVFRMEGEDRDLHAAAARYGEAISHNVPAGPTGFPRFDLLIFTMGEDGHAASLFPGTDALEETLRVCVENHVPQKATWRLTLTYPVINAAREIWMIVTGEAKAQRVAQALGVIPGGEVLPASFIRPSASGQMRWWLDHPAAAALDA